MSELKELIRIFGGHAKVKDVERVLKIIIEEGGKICSVNWLK